MIALNAHDFTVFARTLMVRVAFHLLDSFSSNLAETRSDSLMKSPLQSQVTLGFGLA